MRREISCFVGGIVAVVVAYAIELDVLEAECC